MERETELTQSWSPKVGEKGGLLSGIPLLVGGELRTFSLPVPLDDDGTDISLKDWQLGPRSAEAAAAAPYSIKPFKGSVRTRFTPIEPRLDEDLSPRGQSSPDHFETPTTPRTPRTSSSGTRSSSVSPSKSFLQEGDSALLASLEISTTPDSNFSDEPTPATRSGGIAFDVTLEPESGQITNAADSNNKSARSLRVSFVENSRTQRPSAPVVRHRSPLRSRSLHPPKEVKALQPKWESSTKIRHPISAPVTKFAPRRARPGATKPRAAVAPLPSHEIESEFPDSSGYLSSDARLFASDHHSLRRSLDSSHSLGHSRGDIGDSTRTLSHQLSRDLTMSPVHAPNSELNRSFARRQPSSRYEADDDDDDDDDDDEEDGKVGMLCGGGISETKLSGDFVRLLSKLCRVSVPSGKQSGHVAKAGTRGRKFERANTTSMSWDPATEAKESFPVLGRHDSLKLLSEKCSNAPTPTYDVHKPRKIRDHEPHIHFYKTISKTLDQKLRS